MAGLANILREKSSIVRGDQDGPKFIQLPEEILLDLMGTDENGVPRFGLGGDVEGGADQGVGGMSNDGNQSNGTESDYGGGGSFDAGGYSGDNYDGGAISDGMGSWGEANGYGSDFSGDGPMGGGESGGTSFGGSSFDGWGESGFGANISGTNGGFGDFGWSGDNIDYAGISDAIGNWGEANGYGRDFEGGGEGGFGGYDAADFGGLGGMGLSAGANFAGMGDAFGSYTENGALNGPGAANLSEADFSIGTDPLQGDLADFAPGPQQTMPSGYVDPEEALTDLASGIAPAPVDLGFYDEPELVEENDIQHPPQAIVDGLFDWDIRSPASLVHPDRRAGLAVALTEQLGNIARGRTLGAPEVGVLAARAAIDYGPKSWETKRGIDRGTMYGQAIAPSQFSGINQRGRMVDGPLNQAYGWAERNPDRANQVKAAVEGVIQGTAVPSTMGALSFSTPGRAARVSGNDMSMGRVAGHAFGNYSPGAVTAYNERVNPAQVTTDDNPAFNTPARAPDKRADFSVDIDPAEVNLADVAPGFTGPVRDSMSLASSTPAVSDWGFSDMLGIGSAMAKDFNDQVPALENQQAYESMPVSTDTLAAQRAAFGDVNAQKVTEEPGSFWGGIGSMLATGLGNFFSTDQPAIAYETPDVFEEQDRRNAERNARSMPFSDIVEDSFPTRSLTPEEAMGQFTSREMGIMPGTASGLVGKGPTFGGAGPAMPGYESMGLPSGRPGSRMTNDPSVWDGAVEEGPIEVDAPRAGALVAGAGVPTMPEDAPSRRSPSTGPARASRGVQTAEVFGPTMPGMLPGTTQYPERGVIAQPSTRFHEKVAEPLGGALAGMALGQVHPGLGLANTVSGLLGGPSTRGLFADSTPGLDLSRGHPMVGDDRTVPQSKVAQKDDKKDDEKGKDEKKPKRWEPPDYEDLDTIAVARRYLGPDDDPRTYGLRRERQYFTAAHGGRVHKGKAGTAALSQPGLSMQRSKRTA